MIQLSGCFVDPLKHLNVPPILKGHSGERTLRRIILGIVCILFSGYAYADVLHPENILIVGGVFSGNLVCFNNDRSVVDSSECETLTFYEGFIYLTPNHNWTGGGVYGINGCGTSAVNPVSNATCPFTTTAFGNCINNEYVLVQTTMSGHFWAVKANSDCSDIATPETTGLVPCRSTDSFDPVMGCTEMGNQTGISVEASYIQLETYKNSAPPAAHCDDVTHEGRMIVDSVNDLLYICTQSGWIFK